MIKLNLEKWGWNEDVASAFEPYSQQQLIPGRVALEYNKFFKVVTEDGDILAEISGKLKHNASSRADLPAVGDWVAVKVYTDDSSPMIQAILPRFSKFTRKTKGTKTEEQVVAANINILFLVSSLNQDLSARRLERYLAVAVAGGANPVIILTKSDLCASQDEIDKKIKDIRDSAHEIPIHAISSKNQNGIASLTQYISEGKTVALVGSSGVGKSTLVNILLGYDRQKIIEIRGSDETGQHATRHRELILLPGGGLLLDTPGMRELQLWDAESGMETTFEDIEELTLQCAFGNCRHQTEPRCAIKAAIEDGSLALERFQNYLKLQEELKLLAKRQKTVPQRRKGSKKR